MGVSGQRHAPPLFPEKETHKRSGEVWKISPPPGFDPRTVNPVASRYTGQFERKYSSFLIIKKGGSHNHKFRTSYIRDHKQVYGCLWRRTERSFLVVIITVSHSGGSRSNLLSETGYPGFLRVSSVPPGKSRDRTSKQTTTAFEINYSLISSCHLKLHLAISLNEPQTNMSNTTSFWDFKHVYDLYIFHSPTNALFLLNLEKFKFAWKYTQLSLLPVSVFDHPQGACTEPG